MINRGNAIILVLLLSTIFSYGQNAAVKKISKSIFTLTTFKSDGSLIGSTHGLFVSNDGDAIASWKPFVGASRAVVIDSDGKKYDVDGIVGANDLYNVCKFHINANTNAAPMAVKSANANSQLWFVTYDIKSPKFLHAKVVKNETFMEKHSFYIINLSAPDDSEFCPFVDNEGKVVALMQQTNEKNIVHGIDASFAASFYASTLTASNTTLSKSLIPTVLPKDYKEAQLSLILAGQQRTTEAYNVIVDKFIKQFPNKPDGYVTRAKHYCHIHEFDKASKDMDMAISVAEDKADQHYNYSDLILQKELYMSDVPYPNWSLDKSLEEIHNALNLNALPIYNQQEGRILFAKKDYQQAYNTFMNLQDTHLAGPENLSAALECLKQMNAPFEDQATLMDSIVASCPKPLTYQSAPYILQRAVLYHNNGDFRKALTDYLYYEKLMVGHRLPDRFYYTRFTCDRDGRIFQQALDDINKAIEINPNQPLYFCEKGALLLRLNKSEEAIEMANKCLLLDVKNADAHAILGTAQCILGKNYEGVLNLEEAKRLGYDNADALIKKYKK